MSMTWGERGEDLVYSVGTGIIAAVCFDMLLDAMANGTGSNIVEITGAVAFAFGTYAASMISLGKLMNVILGTRDTGMI